MSGAARAIALALVALAVVVLIGWWSGIEWLKTPLDGTVSMKANAACGLLLLGIALWQTPRRPRRMVLVLVVLTVWGGLHLAEDFFGWNFGIDELLFREPEGAARTPFPGRMSPVTSLSIALLGISGLLTVSRRIALVYLGHGLAFLTAAKAMLSLAGYLYGVEELYTIKGHTAIAPHTAAGLFLGSIGILLSRQEIGIGRLLGLRSTAGVMFRSALPTVVLIPILIGWVSVMGVRSEYWSMGFATSLTAILSAAVMLVVLVTVTFRARETEAMLTLRDRALESTEVAVLIVDATVEDYPIVEVNTAFEVLSGYDFEEIEGRNCRFLNANCRDQEDLEIVREALRNEQSCDVVLLNHKKDGTPFWNRLAISPVRSAFGRVTHYVGVIRDVSGDVARQREREDLLQTSKRAQEEAERAVGARDEFLGVVSHELRSPLHSARLWASILVDGGGGVDSAEVGRHLVESIDAQSRLVSDLLDITRFSGGGGLELDLVVADLRPLVASMVDNLAPLALEGGVGLQLELIEESVAAKVDPDRFGQIVRNLVENAIKFSAGGAVQVSLGVEAGKAVFRVADSGCGISDEDREKIFGRFWQTANRKDRKRGLGLGLTIVEHLVTSHGGEIEVESEGVGKGSTFQVSLPVVERLVDAVDQPPRRIRVGRAQCALVVDDESSARIALESILTAYGFQVRSAASGEEAIAQIEDQPVSLLISDIMLTGMSGLELVEALRDRVEFGEESVAIAVSGHGSPADRRQALEAGFDAFLPKPVISETLLALISAMMVTPVHTESGDAKA